MGLRKLALYVDIIYVSVLLGALNSLFTLGAGTVSLFHILVFTKRENSNLIRVGQPNRRSSQ